MDEQRGRQIPDFVGWELGDATQPRPGSSAEADIVSNDEARGLRRGRLREYRADARTQGPWRHSQLVRRPDLGSGCGALGLRYHSVSGDSTGPFTDWLIRAFLLASVAVAFEFALYLMGWELILVALQRRSPCGFSSLEAVVVIIVLTIASTILFWRVVPRWCPDCRSPALVPDVRLRGAPPVRPANAYRCILCGGQYQQRGRTWQPLSATTGP
jgi:hypothetical protein